MSAGLLEVRCRADSVEDARARARAQRPDSAPFVRERILCDGSPQSVTRSGDTEEQARATVTQLIPEGAVIVDALSSTPPKGRLLRISARDEHSAREAIAGQIVVGAAVKLALVQPGRRGILGLWKSPSEYEIHVTEPATASARFRPQAEVALICSQVSFDVLYLSADLRGSVMYGEDSTGHGVPLKDVRQAVHLYVPFEPLDYDPFVFWDEDLKPRIKNKGECRSREAAAEGNECYNESDLAQAMLAVGLVQGLEDERLLPGDIWVSHVRTYRDAERAVRRHQKLLGNRKNP